MHRFCLFVIASVLLYAITASKAGNDEVQLGLVTYPAFECRMFADLVANKEESEHLFNWGIRAGRQFLEALTKGRLSEADVRSHVPIGITLRLGGPSVDFTLCRIDEGAADAAFGKIVRNENGLPLQKWIDDKDLRRFKAENKYHRG